MSRIPSKDTSPERRVRSFLHLAGYRFRLHRKDLPGTPDIVLPKYRKVIFVHGCFWHRHEGCKFTYTPKTRIDFWQKKFEENIKRDQKNRDMLLQMGWKVEIVWECETKDESTLKNVLGRIFN
jgi:DNA mismatch endonuclease (patch repair protein)